MISKSMRGSYKILIRLNCPSLVIAIFGSFILIHEGLNLNIIVKTDIKIYMRQFNFIYFFSFGIPLEASGIVGEMLEKLRQLHCTIYLNAVASCKTREYYYVAELHNACYVSVKKSTVERI